MRAGSGRLQYPEATWYTEYRFRRAFNLTHDQYLAEPGESVQWMLRIHDLVEADRARREKEAAG